MRWRRPRRRRQGHGLTVAEANLRAQCAAVDQPRDEATGDPSDPDVIDIAAVEQERLFDAHPRVQARQRGARER